MAGGVEILLAHRILRGDGRQLGAILGFTIRIGVVKA